MTSFKRKPSKFKKEDIFDIGLTNLDINDDTDDDSDDDVKDDATATTGESISTKTKESDSVAEESSKPPTDIEISLIQLVTNRFSAVPVEMHFATRAIARKLLTLGIKSAKSVWKKFRLSPHFPNCSSGQGNQLIENANLNEEVLFILEEIGDRETALKKRKTKYISFGIGSGSPRPNERNYLECEEDLKLMRKYCETYNYFLGSTLENGSSPTLAGILAKIRYTCVCAFEIGAHVVLYYTGHADVNGNWWFYDGDISLEMVLQQIATARGEVGSHSNGCKVFIVADCCFAGRWCQDLQDANVLIISAAGAKSYSYDGTFTPLFFDDTNDKATIRKIGRLRVEELRTEIAVLSPSKTIDRSNQPVLKERLLQLITSRKQTLIKNALKCKPSIATDTTMLHLKESELVERLWFNSYDEELDWLN